jgi:lipid-binding SYLF domain-containing protein
MTLKRIALYPLALLLTLAPALAATQAGEAAAAGQVRKIEQAIRVLEEMTAESDKSIPVGLIEDCAGLAVIPDVIKAGFILGGRHGKGVFLVRAKDGGWSDPSFVDIKSGSIGFQAGVQSADIILVFMTPRSIENIGEGKYTLGADAGVAAGPLGRTAEASTDSELKAEILAYSRSRGLFAGLSIQGSSLQEDRKANRNFYGADISPKDIFEGKAKTVPEAAARLKSALEKLIKE